IGHRIVHGGEKYTSSVVIDESVIQGIKDSASFAPLHNPAHLITNTHRLHGPVLELNLTVVINLHGFTGNGTFVYRRIQHVNHHDR
ncbi:hypothetical protein MJL33_29660, partial [Salmonella enterica subsp. enterica serovar Kentucky]|nr:hypothetical protein [Salmonella enterica subsp. enterica serovar Kentucky]